MNAFQSEDADHNLEFDALVVKYEQRIYNVIYRYVGDKEEATDLTQETFFRAHQHYEKFRGDPKVFTWLYQIARNLCINRLQERGACGEAQDRACDVFREMGEDAQPTQEIGDDNQPPRQRPDTEAMRQRVMAAMEKLPLGYKQILMLREFQHRSFEEIAEETGLTIETVKVILSLARGRLRELLGSPFRM